MANDNQQDVRETASPKAPAEPQDSRPITPPSLPKGGGAIRGIGEKVSANPANGSIALNIPIYTAPGRAGFQPGLGVSYDAGSGNGPFGFGWSLSIPSISRKTELGLPRYSDAEESDTFVISGAEDLVPALVQVAGEWKSDSLDNGVFHIERYKPRVESQFARIERWRDTSTADVHWRSISRDNITGIFGRTASARVADPAQPDRIFRWLLEESFDSKGNVISYVYKAEDGAGIDASRASEKTRTGPDAAFTNRYLKRIFYGNDSPGVRAGWHFEVVFDYGDEGKDPWPCRLDPFSNYRPGFEVRTYRLCRRVRMFHHFGELSADPYLVRSTDFKYTEDAVATFLNSVSVTGYIQENGGSSQTMPPVDFTYTEATINPDVNVIDPSSVENLPAGLGRDRQWLDLDSEGISGVLAEQPGGWVYKRNLGQAQFAPLELVGSRPEGAHLGGGQQFMDIAGAGTKALVDFGGPAPGFEERTSDGGWEPFRAFTTLPDVSWDDPNLKFIDLDGDGASDILLTENDVFRWYPSRQRDGFGPPEIANQPRDEEKGPALVFSDETRSIYLADMSGDGLTDIVRIRNGEVCYWPNLGYGRFGAKITMDQAPLFDFADSFRPDRVKLGDIDGSGTTDIVYVGRDRIRIWRNQSGNGFQEEPALTEFPGTADPASVTLVDLLGNGTSCLVWSSPFTSDARQPMRYIDLMGGSKPHLLRSVINNLGAETRIQFASSTKFYLDDRAAGTPWVTRLPFPVQVVEQMESRDAISGSKLVTTYSYHHGYYDAPEREFRGFGRVDQRDTQSFADFKGAGLFTEGPHGVDESFHLPPVITRTWFHTGAFPNDASVSTYMAHEYYAGDPQARRSPDSVVPLALTAEEDREARRAFRGQMLRQEIFSDDGSPDPYSLVENSYEAAVLQPRSGNRHAVFFAHPRESVSYKYERHPADPRISHQLTLKVDPFGNTTQSAAIAYPRRIPDPKHPAQSRTAITYVENDVINRDDPPDWYRIGMSAETRTYELTAIKPGAGGWHTVEGLVDAGGATEIAFETVPAPGIAQKRLIERVRRLYYRDYNEGDVPVVLPLGQIDSRGLLFQSYRMAATPGLIAAVFAGDVTNPMLTGEAAFVQVDGVWWIPSGTRLYSPARFCLPVEFADAFGGVSTIDYDPHALLPVRAVDPLNNTILAVNDYRTMQPAQLTEPNGNRSAVQSDEFGRVIASAVMGKLGGPPEGDTLGDPTTKVDYHQRNWIDNGRPAFVHIQEREQHGVPSRWHETFSYSDGFGREILKKEQAEPGIAWGRDAGGKLVQIDTTPAVRWVGSGRTVFDNKGNAIKKYEPFFSVTADYEDEADLVMSGMTSVRRYDPLSRLIRSDHPNGTYLTMSFDAWTETAADENDNVLDSRWLDDRKALPPGDPEGRAAQLAKSHANTPSISYLDPQGRVIARVVDNGGGITFETRFGLDVRGNMLTLTDPKGNTLTQVFDIAGRRLSISSPDAGIRRTLSDAGGQVVRAWDSRKHQIHREYDALRRLTHVFVSENGGAEVLRQRTYYGESHPAPEPLNIRGKMYQQYDGAGVLINDRYDFKSNVLSSTRRLMADYHPLPDWSALALVNSPVAALAVANAQLDPETFTSTTKYDALNRPISLTAPDDSEIVRTYNQAGLLETVGVRLRGAGAVTPFVTDIDYNARGAREKIVLENGAATRYIYDPLTFRLAELSTTRAVPGDLQDLLYTYDPVANVMSARDRAQQTIYFDNVKVSPDSLFEYDPAYRLTRADGREHAGQNAAQDQVDAPAPGTLLDPADSAAMRAYTERYEYDGVGNIQKVDHTSGPLHWIRAYQYDPSSNRLLATRLPGDPPGGPYTGTCPPDEHGNFKSMPHLASITWDYFDRMIGTDHMGGGTTFYAYDNSGQRVRKVAEKAAGVIDERIYLGAYELYRRRSGAIVSTERQSLHVLDDRQRVAIVETLAVSGGAPVGAPMPRTRYQFDNLIGSACLELDEAAAVISYEEYLPFGTTAYFATGAAIQVSAKRYRYTRKERDEETGFYYHGARYYAPWLARWTSCDPLIVTGNPIRAASPSPFAYAKNSPAVFTDPSGRDDEPAKKKDEEVEPDVTVDEKTKTVTVDYEAPLRRSQMPWFNLKPASWFGSQTQSSGGGPKKGEFHLELNLAPELTVQGKDVVFQANEQLSLRVGLKYFDIGFLWSNQYGTEDPQQKAGYGGSVLGLAHVGGDVGPDKDDAKVAGGAYFAAGIVYHEKEVNGHSVAGQNFTGTGTGVVSVQANKWLTFDVNGSLGFTSDKYQLTGLGFLQSTAQVSKRVSISAEVFGGGGGSVAGDDKVSSGTAGFGLGTQVADPARGQVHGVNFIFKSAVGSKENGTDAPNPASVFIIYTFAVGTSDKPIPKAPPPMQPSF
jgi:RHS repeat-associated protein